MLREGERIILVVVDLGVVSKVDSTVLDMVISVGYTRQSSKLSVGQSPKDTRKLCEIKDASLAEVHSKGEKFAQSCKVDLFVIEAKY